MGCLKIGNLMKQHEPIGFGYHPAQHFVLVGLMPLVPLQIID